MVSTACRATTLVEYMFDVVKHLSCMLLVVLRFIRGFEKKPTEYHAVDEILTNLIVKHSHSRWHIFTITEGEIRVNVDAVYTAHVITWMFRLKVFIYRKANVAQCILDEAQEQVACIRI